MNVTCATVHDNRHDQDVLVVIIGRDGVARMNEHDPATIDTKQFPHKIVNPMLIVAIEDDSPELERLLQSNDVPRLMEFVQRGFKHKPELGDGEPYTTMGSDN